MAKVSNYIYICIFLKKKKKITTKIGFSYKKFDGTFYEKTNYTFAIMRSEEHTSELQSRP